MTPVQYYKAQRLFLAFHGGHVGLRKEALDEISSRAEIKPSLGSDPALNGGFRAMLLYEFVLLFEKGQLQVDNLWEKCLGGDSSIDKMHEEVMQADANLPKTLSAAEIHERLSKTCDIRQIVALKTRLAEILLVDCSFKRKQDSRLLEDARKELLWVLKMDPAYAKAHVLLGVALFRMGRSTHWAACTSTRRALMLRPDLPWLWSATALVTRLCGDDDETDHLERAGETMKRGGQPEWHPFKFLQAGIDLDHLWQGCDGLCHTVESIFKSF